MARTQTMVQLSEELVVSLDEGWGDLSVPTDAATEELLLRLDAEERAGGHDPW